MRDYMKGLHQYVVTITAGLEHTASTFTETFVARSPKEARRAAELKYHGCAVGNVRLK